MLSIGVKMKTIHFFRNRVQKGAVLFVSRAAKRFLIFSFFLGSMSSLLVASTSWSYGLIGAGVLASYFTQGGFQHYLDKLDGSIRRLEEEYKELVKKGPQALLLDGKGVREKEVYFNKLLKDKEEELRALEVHRGKVQVAKKVVTLLPISVASAAAVKVASSSSSVQPTAYEVVRQASLVPHYLPDKSLTSESLTPLVKDAMENLFVVVHEDISEAYYGDEGFVITGAFPRSARQRVEEKWEHLTAPLLYIDFFHKDISFARYCVEEYLVGILKILSIELCDERSRMCQIIFKRLKEILTLDDARCKESREMIALQLSQFLHKIEKEPDYAALFFGVCHETIRENFCKFIDHVRTAPERWCSGVTEILKS